jgi:competence protein ComEC
MISTVPVSPIAFSVALAVAVAFTTSQYFTQATNRTKIVFCDVGQGDSIYIRTRARIDILIDAGPNRKVLDCLGKHMPLFDRTIELAIITHPQTDHYYGYMHVLKRYTVKQLATTEIPGTTKTYRAFQRLVEMSRVPRLYLYQNQRIDFSDSIIDIYWPPKEELATEARKDLNNTSIIFAFREGGFSSLFTGDAPPDVLARLPLQANSAIDILKVPHHGSKNGLTGEFLRLADPTVSVISVGKNNRYRHPSEEIIALLQASKGMYYRTDEDGTVIVTLEGNGYSIKNSRHDSLKRYSNRPKDR